LSHPRDEKSDVPKELKQIIEVKEETDQDLQDFANKNNVLMLAFIGSYIPRMYTPTSSGRATMTIVDEFGIEEALTDLCKKVKNLNKRKVFLLVNSIGGSLSSAYKTAKAVREAFSDITVFVPHYALSGGTLLALTGNRIRMGMMSQLSPLDVQIDHNDIQVSVNSLFRVQKKLDDVFATQGVDEVPYPYKHMVDCLDPIT
jgi:ClpP class serine protease